MLMRIPSDDGGLGVMGREKTDDARRGGLDENKQSARVPEGMHSPSSLPSCCQTEGREAGRERVHLLQRALFLEATYLMREQRGFAEE